MSPLLAHKLMPLWIVAFATGILLLFARPAHGVSLSWNAFDGAPGSARALDLACTTGDSHELVADFEVPEAFPGFVMMEVVVALGGFRGRFDPPPPPLSPFWHFEAGGCNQDGSATTLAMPADPAGRVSPWGLGGGQGVATTFYAPDYPADGSGRFVLQLLRVTPTTLVPGQRYFAFRLILNTCDADACGGCDLYGGIAVISAILVSGDGQHWLNLDPYADGGDPMVCMNTGGWCGIIDATDPARVEAGPRGPAMESIFRPVRGIETLCGPTPARRVTWGGVKIRYR